MIIGSYKLYNSLPQINSLENITLLLGLAIAKKLDNCSIL